MKTLIIGNTTYNLAYLISITYKAKTKKVTPSAKSNEPASTETLKSASSLELHFLDCDTIHLKKEKADAVWSKLSVLLELDQDESPPETEISTPS